MIYQIPLIIWGYKVKNKHDIMLLSDFTGRVYVACRLTA